MNPDSNCYVCKLPASVTQRDDDSHAVHCPRCGNYIITESLVADNLLQRPDLYVLSGVLRQRIQSQPTIKLSSANLDALIKSALVPADPLEAIDLLLLYLVKHLRSANAPHQFNPQNDYPLFFAKNDGELRYFVEQATALHFVKSTWNQGLVWLDIDGWKRVSQLRAKNRFVGKRCFIAMQFGDSEHTALYRDHFKQAVAQTGFELFRLDEVLQAGLIDNQLRVQIRNSRFLLADLTNQNLGAYWEAGYAEGLGIPVIYLCKESDFTTLKTHFDTNHHTTIRWDPKNMRPAVEELKATIRATFPSEAKFTDTE